MYLVIYRLWSEVKKNRGWQSGKNLRWLVIPLSTFVTFLLVNLSWVYFRAQDAATATKMVGRMISWDNAGEFLSSPILLISGLALITSHFVVTLGDHRALYRRLPMPFKIVGYAVVFCLISISSIKENTPFIYFQF